MKWNVAYIVLFVFFLVSCGAEKNMKRGDQAFAIGEYYEAASEYAKAYSKYPAKNKLQRGKAAYKIGESNRKMGNSAKALSGYRNAARYKDADTLIHFYMGEMERYAKDYKSAAKDYQLYLDSFPGHDLSIVGLQSCAAAPIIKETGSNYIVKEAKFFNSNYSDFSPSLVDDMLFFSSTRKECNGDELSGITGMLNGDIFFCSKDEKGKWKRPEAISESVNSKYDEGACTFSPDGKTMYFTRCVWDPSYPRYAQIFSSSRSDASWGTPTLVEISKDTLSMYAHPAISPDGKWMYFVSDMPGSMGGTDIWRVGMTGGHGLGVIENLGPEINTTGDEKFPTFRPNGDLYYSSNGKVGMGGLDIYCATYDTITKKHNVVHLPYPVNSQGDDFGMTFDGVYNRGFFSSTRSNIRGRDNIYSFECPEIIQSVKGWVYEQDGYELPEAVVYMVGDDGTNKKISVKLDGSFEEAINPNVNYLFLATCEGYMNYKQELCVSPSKESEEHVLQFPLPSMKVPVLVRNVFYEFNKADITPQSIPALDALTQLLKNNTNITIELSAHCDYRGSDAYNELLSQKRAESVTQYLTSHGVDNKRVIAKGYGESKPKVITKKFSEMYPFLHTGDTLTEDFIKKLPESQQDTCNAINRRTEFSVLRTTYGLVDEHGELTEEAIKKLSEGRKE